MFGNSFEETLDFCLFASQQIIFWSNPSLSLSLSLFYFFFNFFLLDLLYFAHSSFHNGNWLLYSFSVLV